MIEDAAHAFGTTYKGKEVGARGDIVCLALMELKI